MALPVALGGASPAPAAVSPGAKQAPTQPAKLRGATPAGVAQPAPAAALEVIELAAKAGLGGEATRSRQKQADAAQPSPTPQEVLNNATISKKATEASQEVSDALNERARNNILFKGVLYSVLSLFPCCRALYKYLAPRESSGLNRIQTSIGRTGSLNSDNQSQDSDRGSLLRT